MNLAELKSTCWPSRGRRPVGKLPHVRRPELDRRWPHRHDPRFKRFLRELADTTCSATILRMRRGERIGSESTRGPLSPCNVSAGLDEGYPSSIAGWLFGGGGHCVPLASMH
jgi:hypothetical protein